MKYEERDESLARAAITIETKECSDIGVVDDENLLNLLNFSGAAESFRRSHKLRSRNREAAPA